MSKNIIPVFYACDDNFVRFTAVSLCSLMENASKDCSYNIHILNTGLDEKMKQAIYDMAANYPCGSFSIYFDDVTEYLASITSKLPIRDYYSPTTYYRFFIAEMFPHYDKAIYIDSDTVVLGDIAELYGYEPQENYLCAAHDQVMLQSEVFGAYTEKVLGIPKESYFSAGVLLINCKKFRDIKLLNKFMQLLCCYNFSVTQDQDYLNILCRGHVLWLPQQWNTQVFGEIRHDSFKIVHYIMVSKPWHYGDCRLSSYFWDYAKKTALYGEIKNILENYTDKDREADNASCERLIKTAEAEISKPDNYLNMLKSGRLKSKERLEVLSKIAQYEREGRFFEDVENDPPTIELKPEDIDYLRTSFRSRVKAKITYRAARSFMNSLIKEKKLIIKDIKGIENFQRLNSGAIITCNHFNAFDSFAIQAAYDASGQKNRRFYRVIREGNYTNFPGFYGRLMRNCYTFPLSSNKETMKKFMQSMDEVLQNGDLMLFYPEQSMWWNYRKPKPLKKGAFIFAARNNVPVLPCFITMEDSDMLGEDGFYIQEYTIHISPPIYPDASKSRNENAKNMMASNCLIWKQIYEETYGEPLSYTCTENKSDLLLYQRPAD